MNTLDQVKEFHETFKQPVLDKPTIPSIERCQLRVNLIEEELDELKEAIRNGDLVEIADALADLRYVTDGTVLEFGLAGMHEEVMNEVHRSNMSKVHKDMDEVYETAEVYNCKIDWIKVDAGYLVYRTSDNKLLKPKSYSPADIKSILED